MENHQNNLPQQPLDAPAQSMKLVKPRQQFKLKPIQSLVLLAVLILVGAGVMALTQQALKKSQENRSDAAVDEPKIWISFMSDPATAGADPVGLTSLDLTRTSPSTVPVWLNNPHYKEITGGAVFVEYDPAVINSISMDLANQSYLNDAQQPSELIENVYNDNATGKKVAVMKFALNCSATQCYPIRTPGDQYLKLAELTITPKANATTNTSIRILFANNNSRSIILVKDYDVSLLQSTGYVALNLNFDGSPNPTVPGGALGKVSDLAVTPYCATTRNQLNWTQIANATSYQIQYCKGGGCTNWSNLETSFTETVYVHTGLTAGLYRYKVRGKNAAGAGAWSDIKQGRIEASCPGVTPTITVTPALSATPSPTQPSGSVPAKVTQLEATPVCTTHKVEVSWLSTANATSYQIQYCKGGGCTNWSNLSTNFTETVYTHSNLTAGVHRYRVRGKNAAGNGAYSDVKQARIESSCPLVTPTATVAVSTPTPTTPFAPTDEPTVTQAPTQLAGDFNEDGTVSLAELQQVMDAYGQTGDIPENVNADDVVDLLDVTIVLANFLL